MANETKNIEIKLYFKICMNKHSIITEVSVIFMLLSKKAKMNIKEFFIGF